MIDKIVTQQVEGGVLRTSIWPSGGGAHSTTEGTPKVWPDGVAELTIYTPGHLFTMGEDVLAARSELLGISDVVDAIEAEVAIRRDRTDVTDPNQDENAWTGSYTVLREREKARCTEVRRAIAEGKRDDPRSPRLRGAMAARRAVTEPVGAQSDRDSLIERVRTDSRGRLGARHPKKPCIVGRVSNPTCTDECTSDGEGIFTAEDRALIRAALTERVGEIGRRREAFLHSLTGEEDDPLAEPEPEETAAPEPDATTLDGLIQRHGGAA